MVPGLLHKLRLTGSHATSRFRHPASDKVLQTYELLEQILGDLDPHCLRQARTVNKYWHAIVKNSSSLSARSTESDKWRQLRTVLIGVPSAGMSSLVHRLTVPEMKFPYWNDPYRDPSWKKQLTIDDEQWIIHGTSGGYLDDRQHASYLGHMLANCETYVLIYAMTSRYSFDRVKEWVARMQSPSEPLSSLISTQATGARRSRGSTGVHRCIPAVLVSTKNDLPPQLREVESSEGATFARELGCSFVETSSNTGESVVQAFVEMCKMYKAARLDTLQRQAKRMSLTKTTPSADSDLLKRKERWWKWYGGKQR